MVLLKPLKNALADGDAIHAVIRGPAINNDGGAKSSYWAPYAEGQAEAMRKALAVAQVAPETVGYIEAHGTATKVGDPTEISAVMQAFGTGNDWSCAIGSVKTNIGHPESAAGVAGLIKAVLSVKHKKFFPTLNFQAPNPGVDYSDTAYYVNTELKDWPAGPFPRRAAVNSLGIGGTNAFAIVEETPELDSTPPVERPCHVLTLSAKVGASLETLIHRFDDHFERNPDISFADACFTTNVGRSHFEQRFAVAAATVEEARKQLAEPEAWTSTIRVGDARNTRLAFLFTGQGSQYVDMGRELYESQPTFRASMDRCAEILSEHLEMPLLDVLYPNAESEDDSPINDTAYTQPALFAVEYSLAKMWESWGVTPETVIGHSVGEYVAACIAGVFSLEDGLRLIAERGRLMQELPRDGGMAAIRCDEAQVLDAIRPHQGEISIAAVNGPEEVVISGAMDALEQVAAGFERRGISVTRLKVSHAFHSHLMEPMLAEFKALADTIAFSAPRLPLISNADGELATSRIANADYWVEHVRNTVRFADGLKTVHEQDVGMLLEIGPKPVLVGMARQCLPKGSHGWLYSLRPGRSAWRQIAETVADLYRRGVDLDWERFNEGVCRTEGTEGRTAEGTEGRTGSPSYRDHRDHGDLGGMGFSFKRVHLPTYPFQKARHWIDPPNGEWRPSTVAQAEHPLLGRRMRLPHAAEVRYEAQWNPTSPGYLDDHKLFDVVVVPGASHIGLVLTAARDAFDGDACLLEDILFPQTLTLAEGANQIAQVMIDSSDAAGDFRVVSLKEGGDEATNESWTLHATGRIQPSRIRNPAFDTLPARLDLDHIKTRCPRHTPGADFYARFWDAGYHLGESFRWIGDVWGGDGEVLCEMRQPQLPDAVGSYPLYPSLIDSCFQFVFSDKAGAVLTPGTIFVPFSIRRFEFYKAPDPNKRLWCHAVVSDPEPGGRSFAADITLFEETGEIVAKIIECKLRAGSQDALTHRGKEISDSLYEISWQPKALTPAPSEDVEEGAWFVFADSAGGVGADLINQLRGHQQRCIWVEAASAYRKIDDDHYQVDAGDADDFERLFADVSLTAPCRGVVHLWGLDTADSGTVASQERPCRSVLNLLQSLAKTEWPGVPRLCLVTRGGQPVGPRPGDVHVGQAPLWGLGRVIALEHPEFRCLRVDLDPADETTTAQSLLDELFSSERDDQAAYRDQVRYVPRLVPSGRNAQQQVLSGKEPFQVRLSNYGQFDNLTFQPLNRRAPGAGEVEIQIKATGLNFRDVLNALGLLREHYEKNLGIHSADQMTFGFECSGIVAAVGEGVAGLSVGEEVIAAATHDSLGSFTTVGAEFVVPKPDNISFEEAVTIPLTFLTASYGLEHLAGISSGDRVLVHAAAGGVGQACVQLAQQAGAEVYATASPAKWEFLRSAGVEHVMNSRNLDFADEVMRLTNGEGVDVVVNALSGEFVDKSFEVLKHGGRFVELGKLDVWSQEQVDKRRPDAAFLPFDLVETSQTDPQLIRKMLLQIMDRVAQGKLKPLPQKVYPISHVVDAFRYMAEGKHIGKIVVAMPDDERDSAESGIRDDSSYLITGGLGVLGIKVASWMVEQGARSLVLTSRRGAKGDVCATIEELEARGAKVTVVAADVSNSEDVTRLLATVQEDLPPLRGIVHAAGVIDDGVLLHQSWDRFQKVMDSKVQGTWNLHTASQNLPLDFFVCFSSVAPVVGIAGQGNYAAANAFMDVLAHQRRAQGLCSLSINWGPWGEAGMAAELGQVAQRRLTEQGFRTIAPDEGVEVFGELLERSTCQVGFIPVDWSKFAARNPSTRDFLERVATVRPLTEKQTASLQKQLEEVADPRELLMDHVRSVVGRVLGVDDPGQIEPRARLFDLGLESLMAVELRNRFEESLGQSLRSSLLFDYPTVEALVEHLLGEVFPDQDQGEQEELQTGETSRASDEHLDGLDEEGIAKQLAEELAAMKREEES